MMRIPAMLVLAAFLWMAGSWVQPAYATPEAAAVVERTGDRSVDPGGSPAAKLASNDPIIIDGRNLDGPGLRSVYMRTGFAPLWLTDAGTESAENDDRVRRVVDRLASADRHGLDPEWYHRAALEARITTGIDRSPMELDLLLTDGLLRYVRDLRFGRLALPPEDTRFGPVYRLSDSADAVLAVARSSDPAASIDALAPRDNDYRGLQIALERLRRERPNGDWPKVGGGPAVKPGMRDDRVRQVRDRLAASGAAVSAAAEPDYYDTALEVAVRAFQMRHGLAPDGIVGKRTIAAMNTGMDRRIAQIIANLERLRWRRGEPGERFVSVNIPDFSLEAVEDGVVRLKMPVIVGTPRRKTPTFSGRITYLVLNPTWTIPRTIAREDIAPKVAADPGYFGAQGIRVYPDWSPDARPVDPFSVDWAEVGGRIARYRMVQGPGPLNPLGRVKFMFPNAFDVYLHDTPAREKFASEMRAFSSGCVRVADPDALADFLMAGMEGWSRDRRDAVVDTGETRTVPLDRPVAVHLVYRTTWIDTAGQIQFRDDIYGHDAAMLQSMGLG